MTAARTPSQRYWIQVELQSSGRVTGATHIDLVMVDKVTFNRSQEDPNIIDQIEFVYAGTMKPVGFKGDRANFAYQQWQKFLETWKQLPEDRIMEQAEPVASNVIVPETAGIWKGRD